MPDLTIANREWQGLIPALEPKNVNKPYVVNGEHFMVDFEGPYTAFSARLASYSRLVGAETAETFTVEDDEFIFTCCGIFRYNLESMTFQPLYIFSTTVDPGWPWSVEKVGTLWYFCRKDIGIIKFTPSTFDFSILVASELPVDPRSICKSYGRLIVLGSSRYAWSNLDDGTIFTSSTATGTGNQGTSAYAPGDPWVVKETADGFVIFSDKAIGKAEIIDLETTFRHYNLSRQHKLINPFAVATLEDLTHVFLTKQGLCTVDGNKPKEFQGLWNQFLIRKLYPTLDDLSSSVLKLYYATDQDWLFIHVASSDNPSLYGKAYGLNVKRGDGGWGVFNKPHLGFGRFNLDPTNPSALFNLGYIDDQGYLWKFEELPYSESRSSISASYFYQSYSNFPSTFSGGIWNPKTLMKITSENEGLLRNSPSGLYMLGFISLDPEPALSVDESSLSPSGTGYEQQDWMTNLYPPDEDWFVDSGAEDWMVGDFAYSFPCLFGMADAFSYFTAVAANLVKEAIGAFIEVGLFRLPIVSDLDEMQMVVELSIGMFDNTTFGGTEDWLALPTETVDWLSLNGQEDWGSGIPSRVTYSTNLIATLDGVNVFSSQVPTLSTDAGAVQFYKPFLTGIFHKTRIAAAEIDQAFHLKFLEMSGSKAGRL